MMRCSSCGFENPDGVKFCNECAAPFPRRCASCGFANPPAAKFCGECAAPLSSTPPVKPASSPPAPAAPLRVVENSGAAEGERKMLTALFADIKGSMDLMEDLDPEEARALVDPALKLMIDAVHRYDGYIVQSTGDGIFALFGAPVAHEDHPQRALYAALRMQDEMRRYSAKLRELGNAPLEARVGINTGEAVVRSIRTGDEHTEYTPIGHSTSLASRMQTLAPTGSIAVTEATQKFCAGYFNFKALGPTRVKGVTEPVNVFEVIGLGPLRTRLQRAAGRGLTKFVGRQREIDAMKHAAEQARAGHGQIVAAMAEAGTGKSRLLFEFKAKNQAEWMVLETFSVSHGKASAYFPVIDLLCTYFKIEAEDGERSRREKIAGRLAILDPSLEDTRPYIFALLGISEADAHHQWEDNLDRLDEYLRKIQKKDPLAQMDGQVRKRRTLDAIKRILLRESLNQPLMVIFEDLHWIDEETQAFLNLLADSIGTARILLLVNYRPEYSHQWNSKTYYTQLRLDPLGKESADEMLSALLGDNPQLAPLKRVIVERTEGNPFFMEETVQVLFDEGALTGSGAAVSLTKPISELKIPPTVQGILAARIDRLAYEAKDLLQTLAVIGREFPMSLIRAVIRKADDELGRLLDDLQLAEFIYEQPAVGDTEYIFKHALTQEVAYNSVLIERRKQVHERVGAALEARHANSLDEHLAELAHHYGRSNNPDKAVDYLSRAAQQALSRSAFNEALVHGRAGIVLIPGLPATPERGRREFALLATIATAATAIAGFGSLQATQGSRRMLELARDAGDDELLSSALMFLQGSHLLAARYKEGAEVAQQMIELAERRKNSAALADALHMTARILFMTGQGARALTELNRAVALCPDGAGRDDTSITADPLSDSKGWTAISSWVAGYPDRAAASAESAIARARDLNQPYSVADTLWFATRLRVWRGEALEVQHQCEEMDGLAEEGGFTSFIAFNRVHRGWVASMNGEVDQGIALIRSGIADWKNPMWFTENCSILAAACLRAGRRQEAMDAVAAGREHAERTGEYHGAAELERIAGETLIAMGAENAEAEHCLRRALAISSEQNGKSWELRATMSLARSLRDTNRRDEARAMLADIYGWFTEGFDTADLKDAKALLYELGA